MTFVKAGDAEAGYVDRTGILDDGNIDDAGAVFFNKLDEIGQFRFCFARAERDCVRRLGRDESRAKRKCGTAGRSQSGLHKGGFHFFFLLRLIDDACRPESVQHA